MIATTTIRGLQSAGQSCQLYLVQHASCSALKGSTPALCLFKLFSMDSSPPRFALQALLAACQQEVQEVVCLCTNSNYTSLQFVVHSFEVLKALPEAARVIARPLPHMGCDQAESFMLNYVEVLAGAAATWPLAAEYLAWCTVYGADTLEALLDKSPVSLVVLGVTHKAVST